MTKLLKFIYVMIHFLLLFIVVINANGKSLSSSFSILFFLLYTIFYHILITLFLFLFHTIAYRECNSDGDCPNYICRVKEVGMCYFTKCYCIRL